MCRITVEKNYSYHGRWVSGSQLFLNIGGLYERHNSCIRDDMLSTLV